ncbi:MAG: sigma-70 family RNA polymerase sigma factor [Phycisphaerales bacterium]
MAALRRGEAAAYEKLVHETTPRLLAIARRMLPNEDDAQDAVQEGFLAAFKGLPSFDGNSRLSTWLHRIVVNACLMKLRSKRRRPERSIEEILPKFREDGHAWEPGSAWQSPTKGLEEKELSARMLEAIDNLPENYRIVLVLRDIQGLDTAETGVIVGLSENAVKTRLHRARQALRELIDARAANSGNDGGHS